jgi:methylated-DNA-[protein]-cysteine S-methyltransferase
MPLSYVFYDSPLGRMVLVAEEGALVSAQFLDGADLSGVPYKEAVEEETPVLRQAREWLDVYFSGRNPGPLPPLLLRGTPFQKEVWSQVLSVPYGRTSTYSEIASSLKGGRKDGPLPCRAVGAAIGRNPLLIFVPCHRILGKDGSLTGYAAGIPRKVALLRLEGSK